MECIDLCDDSSDQAGEQQECDDEFAPDGTAEGGAAGSSQGGAGMHTHGSSSAGQLVCRGASEPPASKAARMSTPVDNNTTAGGGAAAELSFEEQQLLMCCVCMMGVKTHLFLPCGHKAACGRCADTIMARVAQGRTANCPLCNKAASGVVRVID